MEQKILNDELSLSWPEGFCVMEEAEVNAMQFVEKGACFCLKDPEKHLIAVVGWKRIRGLAAMLLNDRDLARQMEESIRKPMGAFGYRLEGYTDRSLGGKPAGGIRYTYTAQDTPMYGESWVVKSGKTVYYFHVYIREGLKDDGIPAWEQILDSVSWKQSAARSS